LITLEHRDDLTAKLLYEVARDALNHEVRDEKTTVNAFLNVCQNNQDQYRILGAANKDEGKQRVIVYANDGVVYNESWLHRFTRSSTPSMIEPPTLPASVQDRGTIVQPSQTPLRQIESTRLTDMEYARQYVEDYMKTNMAMK
ncbi:hypothetical protein MBANPS3_011700, partial [Mucor bainieri]